LLIAKLAPQQLQQRSFSGMAGQRKIWRGNLGNDTGAVTPKLQPDFSSFFFFTARQIFSHASSHSPDIRSKRIDTDNLKTR
jgi:hypothetical protein